MKVLFLAAFLSALTIIYSTHPATVRAEAEVFAMTEQELTEALSQGKSVYGRVASEGIFICADRELTDRLFELPKSYCVAVQEYASSYARVTYCYEDYDYARGVCGYVCGEGLLYVSSPPEGKSFPNVFAEFEGNGTFYKNNTFTSFYSAAETAAPADAFFYGYYPRGEEKYCYVLRGGKFGYYSAEVFAPIVIPPHPDPMPKLRPTSATPTENPTDGQKVPFFTSDSNKAIFIVVCSLLAVCLVYAIFLPKKRAKLSVDEDEP